MKDKGGRPSKYGPNILQQTWRYYNRYELRRTKIPFLEELEIELDISRDTRNRWMKKYPNFKYAIGMIKALQKLRLMERCIYSRKNVRRYIFFLITLHGMRPQVCFCS